MARQLGVIFHPETREERKDLEDLRIAYWGWHHAEAFAPYADTLAQRLAPANLADAKGVRVEAPAFMKPGLAAALYPDLFRPDQGAVDKDGLVDYAALTARLKPIQPGVFHDPVRDVVLFAHRFFRRSLSHGNTLNAYALGAFTDIVDRHPGLTARLRLDPDLVGHPDGAQRNIELEYWRGPKFDDDIANIPSGVAEHKATGDQRSLEGIDKTHLWWTSAATRREPDRPVETYRTFQVEELVEHASAGLQPDTFGCRYAHAEFNLESSAITHFDGAIRAYGGEAYLERIETSIDHAGKHADYTKLFRFDGPLPVADWKRMLTDYYRGNTLIPEYLGEPRADVDDEEEAPPSLVAEPRLAGLLTIGLANDAPPPGLQPDELITTGPPLSCVELGDGAVADLLRPRAGRQSELTIADGVLNLSTIVLDPDAKDAAALMADLAKALAADHGAGRFSKGSLALAWTRGPIAYTLSLAGDAGPVSALLGQAADLVRPEMLAAAWIEALNTALKALAPPLGGASDWASANPFSGRLTTPRQGEFAFSLKPGAP
jgi:hypothetical protein